MTEAATGNPAGLILASASPRRQSLLKEAGYVFTVQPADIDEKSSANQVPPITLAERLAFAKAQAISLRFPDHVVLAADTIVALGDRAFGKPADASDARAMLQVLSGTTQVVVTAVCIVRQAAGLTRVERVLSAVRMAPLTASEIESYIASGQWQGKAGAYGIQDPDPFVERIRGCRTNIVGLPMKTTARLLESAGIYPVKS
jgi:septum formation protein